MISVAPTSVHLSSRRGLTQWHLTYGTITGANEVLSVLTGHRRTHSMKNLSCMSYLGKGNAFIVVAGCQSTMMKVDVERGRIVDEVHSTLDEEVVDAEVQ